MTNRKQITLTAKDIAPILTDLIYEQCQTAKVTAKAVNHDTPGELLPGVIIYVEGLAVVDGGFEVR